MQMTAAFDTALLQPLGRGLIGGNPGPRPARDHKKFPQDGIAARDFLRRFRLAKGIEVIAAALETRLRRNNLAHPTPEPSVKVEEIQTGGR